MVDWMVVFRSERSKVSIVSVLIFMNAEHQHQHLRQSYAGGQNRLCDFRADAEGMGTGCAC